MPVGSTAIDLGPLPASKSATFVRDPVEESMVNTETLLEFWFATKRKEPKGSTARDRGPSAAGKSLIFVRAPVRESMVKADTSSEI